MHIYWNFNRLCWSVRAAEGAQRGWVIAYRQSVRLTGCRMMVRQSGLDRARTTGEKNVHAVIKGEWVDPQDSGGGPWTGITYNPFREGFFVWRNTGERVDEAHACRFEITEESRPRCEGIAL